MFDVAKAKQFCLEFLGFRADGEHRFEQGAPIYIQIARLRAATSSCISASTMATAVPAPSSMCAPTQLDDFQREITAKGHRFMRPGLERTPWRSKLMEVTDPFNDRLRFDGPLEPSP